MNTEIMVVFFLTYAGLIICGHPKSPINRWQVALIGAAAVFAIGGTNLRYAWDSISWDIIAILFGLMVISGYMRQSGLMAFLTDSLMSRISHQRRLLLALVSITAIASAFLTNDVVCLILAPLVVGITKQYKIDPMPYLLAVATASNAGSVATLSGNPQNIIIGVYSGISYLEFFIRMLPIAVFAVIANFFLISVLYRKSLAEPMVMEATGTSQPYKPGIAVWVFSIVVIAFFFPIPMWVPACIGAVILLGALPREEHFWRDVNLPILFLFIGFFILVDAMDRHVVHSWDIQNWPGMRHDQDLFVTVFSAVFSNIVSNVPLTLLFKSLIQYFPEPQTVWLLLSASCTLAGNATLFGSFANMIVAEQARPYGIRMGYWQFLKLGLVSAIITIVFAHLYITRVIVTFS